ncbi:MAG: sodium:calcium antiporter [Chloroflexi bacterium]|nr:sodium:calcium antiporter [Chloroflexota bacterium]
MVGMGVMTLPGLYMRLSGTHMSPVMDSAIYGIAILGAAFILTSAAEVAEVDISQSLALAFLAFIAVLPEYAVDLYFAWAAAQKPEFAHYAIANMTGANRLLIGFGWSLVVLLFWLMRRQRGITVEKSRSTDIVILSIATLYAFTIPLKGSLSLVDTVVLLSLFIFYLWAASKAPVEKPELVGPAEIIASLPTRARRSATLLLFVFSATVILASAEPFAEGLVAAGETLGIDKFLLVQWLAPLASEAPEIIVACVFVMRGSATMALGTLVSSKVNQWTLLVGTLPLVYSVSLGGLGALPLDARQVEEVFLTAAQSAFAILLLANLTLSRVEALALFVLFGTQLLFTDPLVRYGYSFAYLALALVILIKDRDRLINLFRMGFTSFRGKNGLPDKPE